MHLKFPMTKKSRNDYMMWKKISPNELNHLNAFTLPLLIKFKENLYFVIFESTVVAYNWIKGTLLGTYSLYLLGEYISGLNIIER